MACVDLGNNFTKGEKENKILLEVHLNMEDGS